MYAHGRILVDAALCQSNPEKGPVRSPSVIVIGGGIAGVAAARALHDASFQVCTIKIERKLFVSPIGNQFIERFQKSGEIRFTCMHFGVLFQVDNFLISVDQVILLEARDRLGGRIYTNYSFGFPVDLGASW